MTKLVMTKLKKLVMTKLVEVKGKKKTTPVLIFGLFCFLLPYSSLPPPPVFKKGDTCELYIDRLLRFASLTHQQESKIDTCR
jgi:hypothetical protein